ncbi:MAG: glycosyltransferase family 4 protein [Burkholderiaceae bacterium]|nr:glycosyltransferase family 4 protein [Burkholderiaceae bacterium]
MYPPRVCHALREQGHNVHAIAFTNSRVLKGFRDDGVPTLEFDSSMKALLGARSILAYIREHDIKILHANKSGDMRLAALLVQLAPELRLFFTDHMGVTKPKKDWYHRWAYSKVTYLFAISKATFTRNLNAFPVASDRVVQLYYGMDFNAYQIPLSETERRVVRVSMGVPEDGVLIALPGRLSPGKGHEVWVKALAELLHQQTSEPWHGVVIGDASGADAEPGGYKDRIEQLVHELGLQQKITFAGFRGDMPRCLLACDISAIPSDNEAFGLSVIESMAAGCAVVGADSGAVPELVGQSRGMLAPAKDPAAWAVCLQYLVNQPELRQRFASESRQWARENFTMERHLNALVAYYRQALSTEVCR